MLSMTLQVGLHIALNRLLDLRKLGRLCMRIVYHTASLLKIKVAAIKFNFGKQNECYSRVVYETSKTARNYDMASLINPFMRHHFIMF